MVTPAIDARGPADRREADNSRLEGWLLALVLLMGLLLRATYLAEIFRAPDFDAPQFEAQYHDYWARALVSGDWTPPEGVTDPEIPQRSFFRPPGYPYFLAAVYRLTGPGYLWPRVVQMAMGLLSAVLVWRFARRWYGAATGIFAAALMAVYWAFIFFEGELMALSLLVLLLLTALKFAARFTTAFTPWNAMAVGGILGLAALVRPNCALLPAVVLLWAGWLEWRRRGWNGLGTAAFLRPGLLLALTAVLVTAPAALRNFVVARDLVWITSNAGVNLFVGTHPDADGYTPWVAELADLSALDGWDSFDYPMVVAGVERAVGRRLEDSEVSTYFTRRALDYAAGDPAAVLTLMVRKLALFWGPVEVSNNKVIELHRRASRTLRFGPGFATVLALALAGMAGLALSHRRPAAVDAGPRQMEVTVLMVLVVASYGASFLPFFVAARFRVPIIPVLAVFAGWSLAWLWEVLRTGRYRQSVAGLVVFLALRGLTGIVWVPYESDTALWHWRQGLLWREKGETDRAIEAFHETLAAEPGHEEAHLALADALVAQGSGTEAISHYRAALERLPDSVAAHNNLAMVLARQGDTASAIFHWEAALEHDPERVSLLNNLAYALATHADPEVRDVPRAVGLAERACELTGYRDSRPIATLVLAYRAAGRDDEAEELLERTGQVSG